MFQKVDKKSMQNLNENLTSCIDMLEKALKTEQHEAPDRTKAQDILNGWTVMEWSSDHWPDIRPDDPMDMSSCLRHPPYRFK